MFVRSLDTSEADSGLSLLKIAIVGLNVYGCTIAWMWLMQPVAPLPQSGCGRKSSKMLTCQYQDVNFDSLVSTVFFPGDALLHRYQWINCIRRRGWDVFRRAYSVQLYLSRSGIRLRSEYTHLWRLELFLPLQRRCQGRQLSVKQTMEHRSVWMRLSSGVYLLRRGGLRLCELHVRAKS